LHRSAAATVALILGTAVLSADDKKADVKPITDAEFVIKAASGGVFEVESSKIAKTSASSADVKKFAERMITDHEKANKELMEVAKKADLGIPVNILDTHQQLLDKVKGAKGADFDQVYMDAQVTAHKEAVGVFSSAAKNAKDTGVKAFAEKTLPTIKEHYELAKKLAGGKKPKD
jgi:putative membrane protein